jgi:hypothetical protein
MARRQLLTFFPPIAVVMLLLCASARVNADYIDNFASSAHKVRKKS